MDTLDANWTTTSWEAVAASEPQVIILLDYQTGTGTAALQRVLNLIPDETDARRPAAALS